jgi:hypothetical protein
MKNKYLNKYLISVVVFLVGPKEQMLMIIVLYGTFFYGEQIFILFSTSLNRLQMFNLICISWSETTCSNIK